jgi:hypothetical protein
MVRQAVASVVTVGLALAMPLGSAAADERDFVAGSAKNQLFEVTPYAVQLAVAAHGLDAELASPFRTLSDPTEPLFGATDVTGHVVGFGELPNGEFRVEGEVTCLRVEGNRATIKYRFKSTRGSAAPPTGGGVQVFVEDNGEPGNGTPDGNATDGPIPPGLFDATADLCEAPRGPFNPVDSGNYVVHDADSD